MKYLAKFIGGDGSMGLQAGVMYALKITGNTAKIYDLSGEIYFGKCPYGSVEAFLNNWSMQ